MPSNLASYAKKTNDELHYIIRDASAAAVAMKSHGTMSGDAAEAKYLDQVNDATTILARRAARSAKSWKCDECGKLYTLKQATTAMANGCAAGCSGIDINEIVAQ